MSIIRLIVYSWASAILDKVSLFINPRISALEAWDKEHQDLCEQISQNIVRKRDALLEKIRRVGRCLR